jgi:TonB family protein
MAEMIWLLVAAELSAPEPSNRAYLRDSDTPVGIMREGVLQSVRVGLTITPEGKVQACSVEVSSGNPRLDVHTCKVVRRRAKFRPATDGSGQPAYGVYRTSLHWWVGDGHPPLRGEIPDMVSVVPKLPTKVTSTATVHLRFSVDEVGRGSACAAESKTAEPILVQLGCEQLLKSRKFQAAKTAEGRPVPSIQTGTVQLRTN